MLKIDLTSASVQPEKYVQGLQQAHTWLQEATGRGNDFVGWVNLPRDYDKEEYARIQAAAKKIQSDSKALVVIGIGGSYLGARAAIELLYSNNYNLIQKDAPNIYFIGNGLSGDAMQEVVDLIGDADFSVNVISKSGTTTEPAVAFRFFKALLEKKYGREGAAKRIYATTDKARGALKSLAAAEGYDSYVVPDDVGGRYSVLTAVGLLPIAVAGVDLDELMKGAASMMETCRAAGLDANPAWQYAAARSDLYAQGKKIEILAGYEPRFRFFARVVEAALRRERGQGGQGPLPRQRGVHCGPALHGPVYPAGRADDVRNRCALWSLQAQALRPQRREGRRRPELPGRKGYGLYRCPGYGRYPAGPCGGRRAEPDRPRRRNQCLYPRRADLFL